MEKPEVKYEQELENAAHKVQELKESILKISSARAELLLQEESSPEDLDGLEKQLEKFKKALEAWQDVQQNIYQLLVEPEEPLLLREIKDEEKENKVKQTLKKSHESVHDLHEMETETRRTLDASRILQRAGELKRRGELQSRHSNQSFEMPAATSQVRIPSGLPKFRNGKEGIDDPEEFLGQFRKVCVAHSVEEKRYIQILPLCLDGVDGKWLERWLSTKDNLNMIDWSEVCDAFKRHFQHPNQSMVWLDQIRGLHMTADGVQRYSDLFLRLADKLGWSLTSEEAIYQYKSGLKEGMLRQLSIAEANHLLNMETNPDVELRPISVDILAKLTLRIEANELLQKGKIIWKKNG